MTATAITETHSVRTVHLKTRPKNVDFSATIDEGNDMVTLNYGAGNGLSTDVSLRDIHMLYLACKGKALKIHQKDRESFVHIQLSVLGSGSNKRRITSYLAPLMVHLGYAEYLQGHRGLAFL